MTKEGGVGRCLLRNLITSEGATKKQIEARHGSSNVSIAFGAAVTCRRVMPCLGVEGSTDLDT